MAALGAKAVLSMLEHWPRLITERPLCSEGTSRRLLRVEEANILECWVLWAEGFGRQGGNTSRKDISFYKKGNQIAGSLLAGWEQCESDLEGTLFIPQL